MSTSDGKFSQKTEELLQKIGSGIERMAPSELSARIQHLVEDHERWRAEDCINLNGAEGLMSRRSRRLLASDMATRVSEGFPGDKQFPAPPQQNQHVDEIEAILISLAKKLFQAQFVEWRAISTSMANASVFMSLTKPGDAILAQDIKAGGNYSYNSMGIPGVAGLTVHLIPPLGTLFEFDVDAARKLAHAVRPRMIVIGGSNVLFPYPIREFREIADEVGAILVFDAAHLGLLIAGGSFQNPLAEGAHILTLSTHKVLGGAVGGLALTNDQVLAEEILKTTFPVFMQTRDQNKYAATAHALLEVATFGRDLAQQMIANARALAVALEEEGFNVMAKHRGYTQTQQIFLDLVDIGAVKFETLCQEANILAAKSKHVGTNAQGSRLTTQEITRQGMKETDMRQVAKFIRMAVKDMAPSKIVAQEIKEFLTPFRKVRYSFDD